MSLIQDRNRLRTHEYTSVNGYSGCLKSKNFLDKHSDSFLNGLSAAQLSLLGPEEDALSGSQTML